MIFGFTAIALAAQLAVLPAEIAGHELRQEAQYRAYGIHRPAETALTSMRAMACVIRTAWCRRNSRPGGATMAAAVRATDGTPCRAAMAPTSISATGGAIRTERSRPSFSRVAFIHGSHATKTTTTTMIDPGGAIIANIEGLDSRGAAAVVGLRFSQLRSSGRGWRTGCGFVVAGERVRRQGNLRHTIRSCGTWVTTPPVVWSGTKLKLSAECCPDGCAGSEIAGGAS